jgi:NADH:ubiquinone oxidoreductase subunit 4 (subunit M)
LRFACFKIDKAKRHQYSTFDVGRSMLDVRCSMFNLFTVPAKQSFIVYYEVWSKASRISFYVGVHGLKVPFLSWTAFGILIYEKSVSFIRPNPKFGAKLAIIWQNKPF